MINTFPLSAASASLVDQFLENGGSAIFGHDTITIKGCGSHTYFNTLAKHVNIELGTAGYTATGSLKIVKRGIFTEYPWAIGDVGSPLTIKPSHVYGQIAHGDVWITFNLPAESDANRVYLSTYGTNAFIQTGHTTGSATEDEQKILANIVFYAKAIRFADDDDY